MPADRRAAHPVPATQRGLHDETISPRPMRSSKAAIPIPSVISACTPRATATSCAPSCRRPPMSRRSASTARRRRSRASTTPACSSARCPTARKRYQLRARFGNTVVDLDDPYRFPPILTDFDLYLLGEGTHQRIYDKLGAHPMTLDGVPGVGFVVLAPNAQARQRGRRFQLLESAAPPDAGARQRLLGAVRAPCHRRRPLQIRHHRPARPACCR